MKTIVSRKLDYFSYTVGIFKKYMCLKFFSTIFGSLPRVQGFKMYLYIEGNVPKGGLILLNYTPTLAKK